SASNCGRSSSAIAPDANSAALRRKAPERSVTRIDVSMWSRARSIGAGWHRTGMAVRSRLAADVEGSLGGLKSCRIEIEAGIGSREQGTGSRESKPSPESAVPSLVSRLSSYVLRLTSPVPLLRQDQLVVAGQAQPVF